MSKEERKEKRAERKANRKDWTKRNRASNF